MSLHTHVKEEEEAGVQFVKHEDKYQVPTLPPYSGGLKGSLISGSLGRKGGIELKNHKCKPSPALPLYIMT